MKTFFSEHGTNLLIATDEIVSYRPVRHNPPELRLYVAQLRDGNVAETTDEIGTEYATVIVPHCGPPVTVLTWWYDKDTNTLEIEEHQPIAWRVPCVPADYAAAVPVLVSPFHCYAPLFVVVLPDGRVSDSSAIYESRETWEADVLATERARHKAA